AFFFSSRRRHTRFSRDWSSDVCSSDLFKAPSIAQSDPTYVEIACRGYCVTIGNENLKPETATSYELGALYQDEQLQAGVMFFQRSEERRVGKEGRSGMERYHYTERCGQ